MHIDIRNAAVMFTGQGAQSHGMGRELAEADEEVMALWKTAEAVSGRDLRAVYWESGDEAEMARTDTLQPALSAANMGLWLHAARKLTPACVAGHSLGEFSALAAAKVLTPETVLELVSLRGRLMQEADPDGQGAMAAVIKLDMQSVEAIVAEASEETGRLVIVANYNSPAQFVVSGHAEAVAAIAGHVREKKGRAIPLAVSGAFHSPFMAEASAEFRKALVKAGFENAKYPVCLNATGGFETGAELLRDGVIKQMTSSVKWMQSMNSCWDAGIRRYVELGPKNVLAKLAQSCFKMSGESFEALAVTNLEDVAALEA